MTLFDDFFSHKIHASKEDWPDFLCVIAHVFNKHDGQEYDRQAIIKDLPKKRWSNIRQDAEFRDEISSYIPYLGVCHICPENRRWVLRMSETARQFLLAETPDVAAFLRLQLALFQLPMPLGISYLSNMELRQQANAKDRVRLMLNQRASAMPLQILVKALEAKAKMDSHDITEGRVSFDEMYTIANQSSIYQHANFSVDTVIDILSKIRKNEIKIIRGENRFTLLNHTELFCLKGKHIRLRSPVNSQDKETIIKQINEIVSSEIIDIHANYKNHIIDGNSSPDKMLNAWRNHYDAVNVLPHRSMKILSDDFSSSSYFSIINKKMVGYAPTRIFTDNVRPYSYNKNPNGQRNIIAHPDLTYIKRERRNAVHADMVIRMCEWLESLKARKVGDSIFIDLWAEMPNNTFYIFEVKSGGDGVLEQIRKGLSQLYEYRYRYKDKFDNPILCLVLPECPPLDWMPKYLCKDRNINLCILNEDSFEDPHFHNLSQAPIQVEISDD